MDQKHTKEPWSVGDNNGFTCVYAETDGEVCSGFYGSTSNAARIVACVNACANIPTEALEAGVIGETVEGLKRVVWLADNDQIVEPDPSHCGPIIFDNARSILAKLGIEA